MKTIIHQEESYTDGNKPVNAISYLNGDDTNFIFGFYYELNNIAIFVAQYIIKYFIVMGRQKGSKMTEEQKKAMREKRAANKAAKSFTSWKDAGNQADSMKAIGDAFKNLFKTIESHGGSASEEMIDTVKSQIAYLSNLTEKKMQDARKKTIEVAEENVRKAQAKLEELRLKYDK